MDLFRGSLTSDTPHPTFSCGLGHARIKLPSLRSKNQSVGLACEVHLVQRMSYKPGPRAFGDLPRLCAPVSSFRCAVQRPRAQHLESHEP